jgi:peptidoglycan/LPS O-acetylase OafA/YrhL
MTDTILNLFFLISRYVHIVATTVIVGGTLFFEMVVPLAIGELKTEVQLALFGRMRWLFRWVVYTSTIALIVTGSVSAYRNWSVIDGSYIRLLQQLSGEQKVQSMEVSLLNRPKWWFIAHLVTGGLSIVLSLLLVSGNRPPNRPLQWMRLNLLVLLVTIFVASASRAARQNLFQPVIKGVSVPAARD